MKNIYVIRLGYSLVVLAVITVMVGINNHFFYKNEEKTTVREMRLEAGQLASLVKSCDFSDISCKSVLNNFLLNSSIRGQVLLKVDGQTFANFSLEAYKDNRKSVIYNERISHNGRDFNIQYEKKVTPSLVKSIFRSMTLSVFEWHSNAIRGKLDYFSNLISFLQYVAIPRSSPAICYLVLFVFLILMAKRYFQTLIRNWEKSEQIIELKNTEIIDLDQEKIKLRAQNEYLLNKLDQAEKIVIELEDKQLKFSLENQRLDSELKAVENQIALENQAALKKIALLKNEQATALEKIKSKYEDDLSLSHELLRQSDEINQKYGMDIQHIQFESQKKLQNLENSLSCIELAQSDLLVKNSRLNADLDAANELMNGVSDDLNCTKQERDVLQANLEELQKSIEQEKKTQNNLMTKDVKKWIAYYLLSNPNFSPKTRNQKTKHNPNNHHGGDYVKQLYHLISKQTEVSQFVTDVKSVNNRFQKNVIVISRLKQKGGSDVSYGYIAEVTGEDDRGSCAGVFLTAQTDWEAIVQAKLLIIHIKQLQHHSIVDKITS
jgi:hypothetical protein